MVEQITETYTTVEAKAVAGKPGRLEVQLISPGQGSSGYYSPEVLEAAVESKVFKAGTHLYFDHPSASENADRPERSVRDLAAVLSEDATWNGAAVVGEADVIGPYRDLLCDPVFQSAVGMSIRASAEVSEGEHEGRRTRIVDELVEAQSVDFVTRAGRGGMILGVLESARPSQVLARAVEHGVAEATANDEREALHDLLKATYSTGDDRTWVWLQDFDETTAWFEVESGDNAGLWQQAYTSGDDGLANALTGDRIKVRQVTKYVPVSPAGQPITQESKEDTMATTQIEESDLTDLREKAGRVQTLESELSTEKARADKAEAELAEGQRETRMSAIIAEADHEFTALEARGLKADAVLKENGDLDEDAFTKTVTEAAAKAAEAKGAGSVRGNGPRQTPTEAGVSEADLDAIDDAVFGQIKEG